MSKTVSTLMVIALIVGVVVVVLGATNYGGIGDAIGDTMANSFVAPIRNLAVDNWLLIGTSGWYILAASLTIAIAGGLFMVFIVYGLFWQKGIQGKLLHKTNSAPEAWQQERPSTTIPMTSDMQSRPTQPPLKPEVNE